MKDDPTWREFRGRFGRPLTWREFLGYIRDDPAMKTRLAVLMATFGLGCLSIAALLFGHWLLCVALLAAMVVVAIVAYAAA
jgi:CHASE2 domain-containing sensor protein